ncbi:hypothetical protein [Bradyrhizobium oligotrophicum]|uniref:hypothetical protein n=1 Tax=Bradyrhizobium oligotrophicum TaxID=44255 RepID=UPI003EBD8282
MGWVHIDQDDYAAGFEAGYRAIKGNSAALPALPAQPATRARMTPFLMGIRKGLEKAGVDVEL